MLCGYMWWVRLYPRGRTSCPGQVTMIVTCTGTQPEHAVNYQLVLQNQDNTEKSISRECVRIMHRRRGRQHDMMSSETFYDIDKGFVKQHKLIAVVHISLIATANSTRQATGAFPSMPNVFQLHFNDASTSDIILQTGEVKIHAHKIVLIAHSALFRGMFQSGTKENTAGEAEMGQIEVLTALISFMYGCLEDIPIQLALPLFVAADAYQ
ncbi:TPA: RCC1 and BTB domain-containing protein 1 [Trebouxia sp. C0006]